MGPSPNSKTKKTQVDPESWRSVEQFKDDSAFKAFEEDKEFNNNQVEGQSNSSKTTTPSKTSKTKASSMTTTPSKSSKSKTSSIGSGNSFDWSSSTTSPRLQADRVQKFGLIFIYYKSRSQADRVWEFGQDQLPKETVRISQLYEAKSLNKLIKVKCLYTVNSGL